MPRNDWWSFGLDTNEWTLEGGDSIQPGLGSSSYPAATKYPCVFISSTQVWHYGGELDSGSDYFHF